MACAAHGRQRTETAEWPVRFQYLADPQQFDFGPWAGMFFLLCIAFSMPRLDRFASVYLVHPVLCAFNGRRTGRVPILMYHSISSHTFGKTRPYYQIQTTPATFAQQMQILSEDGYTTLNLREATERFSEERVNGKFVVITFDDGYLDFYAEAFPVLHRYGFTATVFLPTCRIQPERVQLDGVDYLNWREVRELHAAGIEFGSHTVTHPKLMTLRPEEVDFELGYSKEKIEDEISAPVLSFSYPYAFPENNPAFVRFLGDRLQNHDYVNAVTTVIGTARPSGDRFGLPRLPVNSGDDPALFRAKIEGGYDWLHSFQVTIKFLRPKLF